MLAAALIGSAVAPRAHAASGSGVIADCNLHLKLTQSYSLGELQSALASLPADIGAYSNCKDVITNAILVAEGQKSKPSTGVGSSGGGGSALPTPLIIVLVILALGAVTLGAIAIRRRPK